MRRGRELYISRKARFSASHRYYNPSWSEEKNLQVFGPSSNPFGHGHNYEVEVTVAGEVDPETGMVLNLKEIDEILHDEVIARMDYRHLNEEVREFKDRIPTTENIAIVVWERMAPRLAKKNARIYRVRIYESPDLYAEYFGETDETKVEKRGFP